MGHELSDSMWLAQILARHSCDEDKFVNLWGEGGLEITQEGGDLHEEEGQLSRQIVGAGRGCMPAL